MYFRSQSFQIPAETIRVAQAAFPKGNNYMVMRDHINDIYANSQFTHLFSHAGRSAEAPGQLALVLVMQYAEGLSDRQAAEAVRSRIDWKYALALPLEDAGFVHGILSQFRDRLIAGGEEMLLLEDMLTRFNDMGLLSGKGKQRTDSTHILAATCQLNRLELVGETMRQALEVLATAYPNWLRQHLQPDWFDRYGARFEEYRLPKTVKQREELAESIGQDGLYLMEQLLAYPITTGSYDLPAITTLNCIWRQQYYYDAEEECLRWRGKEQGLPPGAKLIQTPYDLEARYSRKRDTEWTGYKVHLTETCEPETPHLITHVETTLATVPDSEVLPQIHTKLIDKNCAPESHLVDAGYIDADNLANSAIDNIDIIGPTLADTSWQGRNPDAFDLSTFTIDWEAQRVTCPEGKESRVWSHSKNSYDSPVIHVRFARNDCIACAQRIRCTRAAENPRSLKLHPQEQHTALQIARKRQETDAFKEEYKKRAGIEGTISLGTRSFDLRRTRYIGLAKTHLHNVLVATAINLTRVISWLRHKPRAQTRVSAFARLASA